MALLVNDSYQNNIKSFKVTRSYPNNTGVYFGLEDPSECTVEMVGVSTVAFDIGDSVVLKCRVNDNLTTIIGTFYLTEVSYSERYDGLFNMTLHGYDALSKIATKPYTPSSDVTSANYVAEAAKQAMGIYGDSLSGSFAVAMKAGECTLYDALKYAVTTSGSRAGYITPNNQFSTAGLTSYSVSKDKQYLLEVHKNGQAVSYSGCYAGSNSQVYTSGSAPYVIVANPYISATQTATLASYARSVSHSPITAKWKDAENFVPMICQAYFFENVLDPETGLYRGTYSWPASITTTYNGKSTVVEFQGFDTYNVEPSFSVIGTTEDKAEKASEGGGGGGGSLNFYSETTSPDTATISVNASSAATGTNSIQVNSTEVYIHGDTTINGDFYANSVEGSTVYAHTLGGAYFTCENGATFSDDAGIQLSGDLSEIVMSYESDDPVFSYETSITPFDIHSQDIILHGGIAVTQGQTVNTPNNYIRIMSHNTMGLYDGNMPSGASSFNPDPGVHIRQERDRNGSAYGTPRGSLLTLETLTFYDNDRTVTFPGGTVSYKMPGHGVRIGHSNGKFKFSFADANGSVTDYLISEANIAALANLT